MTTHTPSQAPAAASAQSPNVIDAISELMITSDRSRPPFRLDRSTGLVGDDWEFCSRGDLVTEKLQAGHMSEGDQSAMAARTRGRDDEGCTLSTCNLLIRIGRKSGFRACVQRASSLYI